MPLFRKGARLSLALQIEVKEKDSMTKQLLNQLWRDESGQDLTEYALLVVLLALACTAGMKTLANYINNTFTDAGTSLSTQAT